MASRRCLFAAAAAAAFAVTAAAPAPPFDLRVETLAAPLLIDNRAPRFSWRLDAAVEQTAYRVLVWAGGAELLWDSGEVASNASAQIAFAGRALASDADYSFLVGVRDGASGGAWANASAPGTFSTGLLDSERDWDDAAWIGGRNQLRAEFALAAGADLSRARAYVAGVGFYELFVNGARVANDTQGRETLVNPGFSTVFSARVLYNAYDVAPLLRAGQVNVVGIRLGMGKYGYLGEFCVDTPDGCNSAILRLTVGASPVVVTALVTGAQWRATTSSILKDHLYNGETVDARIEQAQRGWAAPGYVPGADWVAATVRAAPPTAALSAHTMAQVTGWEPPRAPVAMTPLPGGAFVFDLGVNGAGRCTLTLPGPTPAGANVTLVHAETLNKDGSVLVGFHCPCACCADGGNCANQTFSYITRGVPAGDSESYRPTFAYSGFRWVQVLGWPPAPAPAPTASALSCVATSSGVAATGDVSFGAASPQGRLLNGVQALVVRTQRSNLASIPTDCPQRGEASTEESIILTMPPYAHALARTDPDPPSVPLLYDRKARVDGGCVGQR